MPIQLPSDLSLAVSLPQRPDSYIILAVYVLLTLVVFLSALRTFRGLGGGRWALTIALVLASALLNAVLLVPASSLAPVLSVARAETLPPAPLLGWLCMLLAGAWLGVGPAMLAALAGGVGGWLLAGARFTQPFEMALIAAGAAFLMQQDYRGWLARALRRPFVASGVAGLAAMASGVFGFFAAAPGATMMAAADYTLSLLGLAVLLVLGESVLNGSLVQLASLAFPAMRPKFTGTESPFYARSLGRRLLLTILPITFVTITAQVIFVGLTALDEANRQTLSQLAGNARSTAELLDSFFVDGQGVLTRLAADDRLQTGEAAAQANQLNAALRAVAFFDEMLLVDGDERVVADAHLAQVGDAARSDLTEQEVDRLTRTLQTGAPQRTDVYADADGHATISFIQPLDLADPRRGALIGRTRLMSNPRISVLALNLPNSPDTGTGYLVDDLGRIIVHPGDTEELAQWVFDRSQPVVASAGGGQAYIDLYQDGARRFIYVRDMIGAPWKVAIELPYVNILRTAAQISLPLLAMFAVIMIGALILLPYVSRRITQPLGRLALAAGRMTEGELDRPIASMGDDEVGRLGLEFERMRQSLKERLDDLSLLLHVSERVAASLDLDRGIPSILEGAMQVKSPQDQFSAARTARLVALDGATKPVRVFGCGDGPSGLTPLDEALAAVTVRDERPLKIENTARSRGAVDPNLVGPGVRAIVALPLRRSDRALGVMWLGFPQPRLFADSEVDLLATLAGQAAVFLENAGLFEAAEGGRQRLQAVLSSTIDAVVVTDRDNRILLCNPAAEIAFGISPGRAVGRHAEDVIEDGLVVDLLTERGDPVVRTAEVLMPDGRTLYGSASSITSGEGDRIGRVAVLRDITHLKELDTMKSEFVATVSHDLRSPLTYMRGYVTMIPMVDQLSSKQQEYLDKIMGGIEQMTALIDDLLDLGRIEAGVGIVHESAQLSDIVREAVESMRSQAHMRKMSLEMEDSTPAPLQGDRQLIKHAVANLIDNAIKYTAEGGTVRVGVDERDGYGIVRVSDNGIGIATGDQHRLFEKFYRVKRRDTIDIRGTGLGLAIVKSIAEWHHGRVWVESQLGRGSTFYIALPMEN